MTTHITLLCDRSGSMASIRDDAQGAVNAFLDEQRQGPDACTISIIDFNTRDTVVYQGPIDDAPPYTLHPEGMTALNDALGRTINSTGDYLSQLPEDERPDKVFFVVQTDGGENSSHEFRLDQLTEMIKHQESKYSWVFVFQSAGPDAFAAGQSYAGTGLAANSVRGGATGQSVAGSYAHTSSNVSASRLGATLDSADWAADVDDDGSVTPSTPSNA